MLTRSKAWTRPFQLEAVTADSSCLASLARRNDKVETIATFEGPTFVGIPASGVGAILLTAVGWGEIILIDPTWLI